MFGFFDTKYREAHDTAKSAATDLSIRHRLYHK